MQYSFDQHGNRTTLTSTRDSDGCTTDNAADDVTQTSKTWTYDADSRQLTGANGSGTYSYDAFGRQTTLPGADAPDATAGDVTLSYYDTDAAHTITEGGTITTYSIDPTGRRVTTATSGASASTVTDHYSDASDSPAWVSTGDQTGSAETAYTTSIAGGLSAASTTEAGTTTASLDLTDLSGAVVAAIAVSPGENATQVDGYSVYDEYGNTEGADTSTGIEAYAWLGAQQRAKGGASLVLMGARLYNSTTGRFTSVDPVAGGNENSYNYPNDPINSNDITGRSIFTFFGFYHWFTYVDYPHISTTVTGYKEVSVHGWWTREDVPTKYRFARVTVVLEEDIAGVWYKIDSDRNHQVRAGSGKGKRATARAICINGRDTKWRGYAFSVIPGLWSGSVDAKSAPDTLPCRV
ncbi:hypothetical protein GCM10022286_30050 [Gryllotalpicola daejeonensis]|uniref:RHS repeat-associated core domain-containing protein n=1 Tax=Gryllotalpicola daejeonensis TaxID=993087 RepID=A0ABP7ZNG3_9MICO